MSTVPAAAARPAAARTPALQPTRSLRPLLDLRQAVDTRAMRALLLATAAVILGVIALSSVLQAVLLEEPLIAFDITLTLLSVPLSVLLAVIAVLAVAGEWSSGAMQSTLLQRPRRGGVLASKVLAALLLAVGTIVAAVLLSALATWAASAIFGVPATWAGTADVLRGACASMLAGALFGIACAILLQGTALAGAVAIAVPFMVPIVGTIAAAVGVDALVQAVDWFDLQEAARGLSAGRAEPSAFGALLLLLVIPSVLGAWRWSRRELS